MNTLVIPERCPPNVTPEFFQTFRGALVGHQAARGQPRVRSGPAGGQPAPGRRRVPGKPGRAGPGDTAAALGR